MISTLITALRLEPLPGEGGFFRQTWRSETTSAIFFLLTRDDFSAVHRIAQDEVWHFYAGDRVEHGQLDARSGTLRMATMGPNVLAGEHPQLVVPANTWQGARLVPRIDDDSVGYALLGCTVSPPWSDAGFELGRRVELERLFPAQGEWIRNLTR
jgi:predicted cupin superfamily sugar epimerase